MTTKYNVKLTQMVKKLLFYFMLTIPVIANASDWYFINDRNSEGLTFFDKESHSSSNGEVILWLQKIRLDDENDNAYSSKQK
jgi:hypothetical protein